MTNRVIAPSPIVVGHGTGLGDEVQATRGGPAEVGIAVDLGWPAEEPADARAATTPVAGWRRVLRTLHRVLCWVIAVLLAVLVIPVSMQVFSRFTHIIPHYIWTEEMARFLFVWVIMLGSMLGVRENTHFDVDVWPRLSPRADARLRLLTRLAVLALALVFVWAGIEFTQFAWYRISELAELPLWLIHIAWPLTGLFWIAFVGEQVVDDWRLARTAA